MIKFLIDLPLKFSWISLCSITPYGRDVAIFRRLLKHRFILRLSLRINISISSIYNSHETAFLQPENVNFSNLVQITVFGEIR